MQVKSLLFFLSLGLATTGFAENKHVHPQVKIANTQNATKEAKGMMYPGFCEIEIINHSFTDVHVFATFDDNTTIDFDIYRYESPHYVSLFYYYYCHNAMYITIQSPYFTVYSGWTSVNSTLRLVPYLNKQVKATVSAH